MSNGIQQQIASAAQANGVPPAFALALANQESGFNPAATGSQGEMGLFQFMPSTAQNLGISNPYDPTQNINGAMSYMGKLFTKYNGDPSLVAAAWNAGEPAVDRGAIPSSTNDYVSNVLRGMSNFINATSDVSGFFVLALGIAVAVAAVMMGD